MTKEVEVAQYQFQLEVMKQVFPYAHEALKCIVLANGAAGAALLTFAGVLVGKDKYAAAASTAAPILLFMIGVAIGAACWGVSYVSQSKHAAGDERSGQNWRRIAVIGYGSCLAAFLVGALLAAFMLRGL